MQVPEFTTRRHPRTLDEAFPATAHAAQWIEGHRIRWRWSRPLLNLMLTAAAGLAVIALVLALVAGASR